MPPLHSVQTISEILFRLRKDKDLQTVRLFVARMLANGVGTHFYLGSELVSVLRDVDDRTDDVHYVFNRLPLCDSSNWDCLITGYVSCRRFDVAFQLYDQMQEEGFWDPSPLTFLKLVQVCTERRDLHNGQKLHAKVAKVGLLHGDLFIGSALIEFYAKFGCLSQARAVFDELAVRDGVLWTTLIEAHAEQGQGVQAVSFFTDMQEQGIVPDVVAFVCSLKACASIQAVTLGEKLHDQIISMGLESNSLFSNTLVDMYMKCNFIDQARKVFDKVKARDVVTWNILAMGYVEHGQGEMALDSFKQMLQEGISPDNLSFMSGLRACSMTLAFDYGQYIHSLTVKLGLEGDLFVSNTLVDMYAKCGLLVEAKCVFDKLTFRDEVTWNVLLLGYADQGYHEEALKCFKQVQQEGLLPHIAMFVGGLKACGTGGTVRDGEELYSEIILRGLEGDTILCNSLVFMYAHCDALVEAEYVFKNTAVKSDVSWNTIITGYWDNGNCEEALEFYQEMQQSRMNPGSITVVCCLKACGTIGAVFRGREIHTWVTLLAVETETFVGNTLVDMYAKCGCVPEAQVVFDNLCVWDNVSWNAVLTGWAQLGDSETVFSLFERMLDDGFNPDFFTFVNVLNVCCQAGLLEEGQRFYGSMHKEYGIVSTSEHHSCMVNLFGRAGVVSAAFAIIKGMPCHPTLLLWHTMLGACQKWGNVELGKEAFGHAWQLDETDTAAYCCMCNIYFDNNFGMLC